MPKTGQRIRKHEMKEDSFVTLAFRVQEYIQNNQQMFMIAIGVVFVAMVGLWLVSSSGQNAEAAADQTLAEAYGRVQANDMAGAESVYKRVLDEHAGTAGAREALFYLANLYFVQGEWAQSISQYETYLKKHRSYSPGRTAAAWMAIADSHQALGDHASALTNYEKALDVDGADYLAGDILLAASRSACAAGDLDRATRFADRLFELSGNTPHMIRIRELLAGYGITYTRGL